MSRSSNPRDTAVYAPNYARSNPDLIRYGPADYVIWIAAAAVAALGLWGLAELAELARRLS